MKNYIGLNTQLREKVINIFEKDFFKLVNNSVFGKTMENIRNRVDIWLKTDSESAEKLVAKPNYERTTIFNENLIAVHMRKTELVFNKPVYIDMAILDISKTLMNDFHYNYMKAKYGEKCKLLMIDTDSLTYEIETDDFCKDISEDINTRFDTSNFSPNHPSGIPTGINKKIRGMFKDECGGEIISEFCGLQANFYAYTMNDDEFKKCNGVKKSVVKNEIQFKDYKDCLFSGRSRLRTMNVFRSHQHEIFTETVNKVALSSSDDKRIILPDKIDTHAHGHWRQGTGKGETRGDRGS